MPLYLLTTFLIIELRIQLTFLLLNSIQLDVHQDPETIFVSKLLFSQLACHQPLPPSEQQPCPPVY